MFLKVGLTEELKKSLWTKGLATTTVLENIIVTPMKPIPAHEKFLEPTILMQEISKVLEIW